MTVLPLKFWKKFLKKLGRKRGALTPAPGLGGVLHASSRSHGVRRDEGGQRRPGRSRDAVGLGSGHSIWQQAVQETT
jgi:hypothetical protein